MPRKITPRATEAEVEQRVSALVKMTLDGFSRLDMCEYALKRWDLDPTTLDNTYFPKVRAVIHEQAQAHMAHAYEDAIERAQQLHRLAIQQKNLRVAHLAQTELNKLQGLYAAQKVEVSGKIEGELTDLSALTFEQLYELKHGRKPDADGPLADEP